MSSGERHSPYYELMDSLAAGGCAICRLARRSVSRYLDSISYESVTDVALRDRLRAARGFCRAHSRQYLEETRDPLGLAIINRDIVANLVRLIAENAPQTAPEPKAWLRALLRPGRRAVDGQRATASLAPTGECPACAVQAEAEGRFAGTLAEYLGQDEVRAVFAREAALCIRHFALSLGVAKDAETARVLVERQLEVMRALEAELAEYARKSDYRFRHERLGSERDAPARSADLLTGAT